MSSKSAKRVYSQEKDLKEQRKSQEDFYKENQIEKKKKKLAAEKCFSLYENGKVKNEVNKLMAQKNEELKIQKELRECTFFPKTNVTDRYIGDKSVNNQKTQKLESNFHERIQNWQQKQAKK